MCKPGIKLLDGDFTVAGHAPQLGSAVLVFFDLSGVHVGPVPLSLAGKRRTGPAMA
jgi:hypothetical protein